MNLKNIIQKGESQTVEFKDSFDRETLETAVAFSNTSCKLQPTNVTAGDCANAPFFNGK